MEDETLSKVGFPAGIVHAMCCQSIYSLQYCLSIHEYLKIEVVNIQTNVENLSNQ